MEAGILTMAGFFNPFRIFSSGVARRVASAESPLARKNGREDLVSNWPRFGVKDFFDYYPFMRLLGYWGSTLAPMAKDKIVSKVTGEENLQEAREKGKKAEKNIGRVEGGAFVSWSLFSFFKEKKALKKQLSSTVAAELGMPPTRVRIIDMRRSANPLVESAMDKFFSQNAIRFGTDIWFLVNLNLGILMKAVGVTAERSVFVQKTAFEQLSETISDSWALNAMSKDELSSQLVRILQVSFRDHKVRPMDRAGVDAHRELFDKMAEHILDNKMGLAETLYVMGGVMLKPGSPDFSMQNLDNVIAKGLKGIAQEKYRKNSHGELKKTAPVAVADKAVDTVKEAANKPAAEILAEGPKALFPSEVEAMAAVR